MNKTLKSVEEFHTVFGSPVEPTPVIPEKSRIQLRLSLILEELAELAEASDAKQIFINLMEEKITALKQVDNGSPSIQESLDALCDLQVVLNGSVLEYGMQNIFDEAFNRVHASNMSKTCSTEKEAILSVEKYKKEGIETFYKKVDPYFIVYRKEDNKILKGIGYAPPKIKSLLS